MIALVILFFHSSLVTCWGSENLLFQLRGSSKHRDWTVKADLVEIEKPTFTEYKDCIRQICTGDPYDGTYQCGECLEYSETKERTQWNVEMRTRFYSKGKLVREGTFQPLLRTERIDGGYRKIIMDGLYGLACLSNNDCFTTWASTTEWGDAQVEMGILDTELNLKVSIIGLKLEGRINYHEQENNKNVSLPSSFTIYGPDDQ